MTEDIANSHGFLGEVVR